MDVTMGTETEKAEVKAQEASLFLMTRLVTLRLKGQIEKFVIEPPISNAHEIDATALYTSKVFKDNVAYTNSFGSGFGDSPQGDGDGKGTGMPFSRPKSI